MALSGRIFRARSQCSIRKTWGTQSFPEGQVVYLICTTKPANTHVGGSYFYTLGLFIQVLRQIIYGHWMTMDDTSV